MTFPFCVPKDRLKFWGQDCPVGKGSPQYPNVIVGIPPRANVSRDGGKEVSGPQLWKGYFKSLFSEFGAVVLP